MKEISGQTRLTGLLGSPIAHSISPAMHNEAFRYLNLDYVYLAFDVNTENLSQAVDGLRALHVKGFNVTMPCKNRMATLCDVLSPAAALSQSVNTVVHENGMLVGHTTDGIGYMQSLISAGHNIIGKKMTLLGAGGAATAILVQAALDGVSEISVFRRKNTSWDKTYQLIQRLNKETCCTVNLYDIADEKLLRKEIADSAILINGTPLGMDPNVNASIITDQTMFHKDLVVSDLIYEPRETLFLKLAREAGCITHNGLYMLLYQGAEAFRLWTGQDMPVEQIKNKYFS